MGASNIPGQDNKFENIVQQAPVGITILKGKEMVVEMANEAYLRLIDKKAADFIGRSLYDTLPEVKDFVEPLLNNVIETGDPYYGREFPVLLSRYGQKELAYFNFVYQPLTEGETITGVIVVANDVTELVKAKQSIEETNKQFKTMVMQSPIPMTIFRGEDLIVETANTVLLETIWRKTEAEVIGKPFLSLFPELNNQKYPALLKNVYETGIPHREKEAYAQVRDEFYYLDFEYAPLKDEQGQVNGLMITVYDVTEKVLARQTIEEAKERLQLVVEATGLANWDLDLTTNHLIYSPRLVEIFGYPSDAVLSRETMYKQLLPEDIEQVVKPAMEKAMKTGVYQYEARIRKTDGSIVWIKTRGKVLFNENNEPVKMLGSLQDITDEKNFSQELERQVKERTKELSEKNEVLEKMNAELKSFAYVSSHDLQEPLRKIQVFADRIQSLEYDTLSDKGKDYFNRIQRAAATMQTLIQDLLAYSRASNNEKVLEHTPLQEILDTVTDELKEQITEKKASITTEQLGTLPVIRFQFKQLLQNLLSNSLKFSKSDVAPVIHLKGSFTNHHFEAVDSQSEQAAYFHLQITDNGIGFDPAYADKIFEIFQRLNSREQYQGTGIGLAIVKKIIDNHHGLIKADGAPGKGARFDIYIPAGHRTT